MEGTFFCVRLIRGSRAAAGPRDGGVPVLASWRKVEGARTPPLQESARGAVAAIVDAVAVQVPAVELGVERVDREPATREGSEVRVYSPRSESVAQCILT